MSSDKESGIYGQSLGFPEELDAIEPFERLPVIPTKFYPCPRCKQERPVLGRCPTCPEFDLKLCTCGHLAKVHSFAIGPRSKKEIDICGSCIGRPENNKREPGIICQLFVEVKN